ncbi:MAG: tetratricopeptide repeat protein [Candidatus Thermoplasmatota archaeon]|nr:tetratricopeptide repeat protein [Euryarchaeota archaeon]MBU4032589.1 tetratricopeptide repeat protein [Candidatus Thermoplasmatota archaeon]MBU4072148.1 tetratricopeptide repeat protein [Candidatus Thermoplasmatota archaeon]MBU4145045.1 tetratricopeptide repeat protein [Candidatus Thermoplasmatota archaeon]MBU4591428.1 tetratricopeptide repeat protein [Candidatus Thermoplasmatota archaeon]
MAVTNDIMALLALTDLSIAKGDYERASLSLKSALIQVEKSTPGDLKQRLDIMMKLAEINHITGQWVDALMFLDNVIRTASEKNMVGVMGEALLTSGTILSKKGKWDVALRKFEQMITLLGARGNHPLMARAFVGKGIIFWRKGKCDEAILLAKKALLIAEDAENDDIMGSAQSLIASAAFDMGNYPLSIASNEKALHHYTRAKNINEVTRILNNTGETYKVMGDYSRAIKFFEEGLKMTSGKGVRRNLGYLFTNLAECHIREGRNTEARYFAILAEENVVNIQDEYLHAMLEFTRALIHENEGEFGKASEFYMSALLKMMSLGIPFDTGVMQLTYSQCLIKQGKKEEAKKHLVDAASSFKRAGSKPMIERAENLLAKVG